MIVAPLARWSSRIALFSACVLLVDVVLHRLTPFPTPVAVNLFAVGVAGGGLAVLVGLIAMIQIWRKGYGGAGSAAVRRAAALHRAGLAAHLRAGLPQSAPDQRRVDGFREPAAVPGAGQAAQGGISPGGLSRRRGSPRRSRKPIPNCARSSSTARAQEAFELVEEAVRKLKWRVATSEPPVTGRGAKPGILEATDTTLVVGFTDDVVVRVEGSVNRSRIDVRSASRYGVHDLGANATRVRRFFAELQTPHRLHLPRRRRAPRPAHDQGRRDGQESERTRSGESGGSQRTSPRSIKCSTCARTERDAALRSLGSRPL